MSRKERRAQAKAARTKNRGGASPSPPQFAPNKASIAQALDLAVNHHKAGRLDDAAAIYQNILKAEPAHHEALHLFGILAHQAGHVDVAIMHMEKAAALNPRDPSLFNNLGAALLGTGNFAAAAKCFRRAIALNPDFFEAQNNLGNALMEVGDFDAAEAAYRQALAINPDAPDALQNLAATLNDQVRPNEALDLCARAIALAPEYVDAHITRGHSLAMQGRLDDAISAYRQALAIAPDCAQAYAHICRSRKFSERDADMIAMEQLIEAPETPDFDRMNLAFGLGKAYEDLELYDNAFRYLAIANKLKRADVVFDITDVEKHFTETKSKFSQAFLAERLASSSETGITDDTPIFIVGMPRSGTTLIEQILSSHPDVHGVGELGALRTCITSQFGPFAHGNPLQGTADMMPAKIRKAAEDYIAQLRRHSESARFITNKMPQNFELIGLIRLMYPNAKIINCTRNAADNCFALYKMQFVGNMYGYAYDQTDIAKYYKLYTDLMAHWHRTLPGYILDVSYESIIDDQRAQTAAMLEFCDLAWDDACMEFHKNDRAVKTASYAQVRTPIYKKSIGSSGHFTQHLKDMLDALA